MIAIAMALQAAWAGPRLDYVGIESCPDAGRFSDEVSARIGAQAFGIDTGAMTVRITSAGAEVMGTLELGEGVRLVRGASCDEVFDGLVVAAATLLGAPPEAPPVEQPIPTPAPASNLVKITIDTTKPGVTVARITGKGTAVASNGAVASAIYYEDLCIAPCSFDLSPGLHEFGTYGKGTNALMKKYDVDAPLHIESRPTSALNVWGGLTLVTLGSTGVLVGALTGFQDCDYKTPSIQRSCESGRGLGKAALAGGALATVGGIPLWFHRGKLVVVE